MGRDIFAIYKRNLPAVLDQKLEYTKNVKNYVQYTISSRTFVSIKKRNYYIYEVDL
jgi:hypothetical protein